jgi:hypothetical protein
MARSKHHHWFLGEPDEFIGGTDNPYMIRWILWPRRRSQGESYRWAVYIHKFLRSDAERDLHDHPFNFWSFVMSGMYCEIHSHPRSLFDKRFGIRKRFTCAYRPAVFSHRILISKPCWTFVVRGPKIREWGFWTIDGWVHNEEYANDRRTREESAGPEASRAYV